MIEWFNIKTGLRFWYQVKFEYRINGNTILYWRTCIGLTNKSMILNKRTCLKIEPPLNKKKWIPKRLLKNGYINMVVTSYLGYLKQ